MFNVWSSPPLREDSVRSLFHFQGIKTQRRYVVKNSRMILLHLLQRKPMHHVPCTLPFVEPAYFSKLSTKGKGCLEAQSRTSVRCMPNCQFKGLLPPGRPLGIDAAIRAAVAAGGFGGGAAVRAAPASSLMHAICFQRVFIATPCSYHLLLLELCL